MSLAVRHPPRAVPVLAKISARERRVAVACSLAVAATYVLIAGLDGALGVPRNDDWGYYRTAFDVLHQGWFAPDPFTRTMLVGQVLLAQPLLAVFGSAIVPLQIFGALFAAVGLWASYLVVRHFLPVGWAAFSVGCLALGPIYGSLAPTFMSDAPSFALQSLALLAGVTALSATRRPLAWLALSLAVAFAAFSVREYAVAVPVAVLGCFALSRGLLARHPGWGPDAARVRRERIGAAALGLVWLIGAGTLYVWRAQLSGPGSAPALHWTAPAHNTVRVVFTCALLIAPAVMLFWRWPHTPWTWRRWVALGTALVLVLPRALNSPNPILTGNYVSQGGAYPQTLYGAQPAVISTPVWDAILFLTSAATLTLLAAVLEAVLTWVVCRVATWHARAALPSPAHPRPETEPNAEVTGDTGSRHTAYAPWLREPALVLALVYSLAMILTVLAVSLLVPWVGDRYLFPVVPYLAAALVWWARRSAPARHPRSSRVVGAVGLVGLAVLGAFQVDAAATVDGAKWRIGEALTRAGHPAQTIDAGLEWFGFHQPGAVLNHFDPHQGQPFWVGLFDDAHVCVRVTRVDPSRPRHVDTPPLASLAADGLFGSRFLLQVRADYVRC
ncbi:hypothetical protein GCM10009868_11200 [Terrabacter aerolatus]|uniref:Glycosyltransferase RgtA/B/C/D-like domain-containing protein n=1 Tax=Terrabacter aerolatus TaxID=422442 RepID=A0A512D3X6_9MICO|nr:glycosyltransferase family 39 protein [Terrabacter aerolatus]GEO31163.1 hypothetical protein TAE01_29730 [Terrabacter aerolatus]